MSKRILLVEDDYALAMGTEYALQSEGYEVICADTLEKARKSLDESISLVLLDVMLPDGNGYTFCKEVPDYQGCVNLQAVLPNLQMQLFQRYQD